MTSCFRELNNEENNGDWSLISNAIYDENYVNFITHLSVIEIDGKVKFHFIFIMVLDYEYVLFYKLAPIQK